jgi:hypothetical protein
VSKPCENTSLSINEIAWGYGYIEIRGKNNILKKQDIVPKRTCEEKANAR